MAVLRKIGAAIGDFLTDPRLKYMKAENEMAQQKWQAEQAPELLKYMGSHPEQADDIAKLSKAFGINLDFARPTDNQLLAPLQAKIAAAKSPNEMPSESDLVSEASNLKRPSMVNPVYGETPLATRLQEQPGDPTDLPSRQFSPQQTPAIQDLLAREQARKNQIQAETARQLGLKEQEAQAGETGRLGAQHGMAPTMTEDEVAKQTALGPVEANNAAARAGAVFDAENTPERQGVAARGAGLKAGATAWAENPALKARKQAESDINLEEQKALSDYKNGEITANTRSMMEGAKMVLPHIATLQQQAENLDKLGLFGPVMSRIRQLGEKAGTVDEYQAAIDSDPMLHKDRLVGKFATELGLMASGAGRVHGQSRGGGSIQMINYMKSLLSANSTLDMFEGRMESLDDYMRGYAAGPNAPPTYGPPTPTGAENPVGQSAVEKFRQRGGRP